MIKSVKHREKSPLIFVKETSGRSYIRFSILSEDNRRNLKILSQNAEAKWLESYCPIAFEIILKELDDTVRCWATLTLGPMDPERREELFNAIHDKLQKNKSSRDLPSKVWTRLITTKKSEWSELKPENDINPQEWIEKHVLKIDESGDIKFHNPILELAEELNNALDGYFNKEVSDKIDS